MKNVYRSLRGVVQETLQKNRTNSVSAPITASEGVSPIKVNDGASLNDVMEEFEESVLDRIGKLKAAVTDAQALVAHEAEHAEELVESLRANIAVLEAKLRESEDIVHKKDIEHQRMEQSLNIQVADLQTAVNEKEEALESRGSEVNDLNSKVDALEKQVKELGLVLQQTKEQAASEAERAEKIADSSNAKIATLEAQLNDTEQIIRDKDTTIKAVEENLTAKIQELESELRDKETLLADQRQQIPGLKSELDHRADRVKQTSSISGEAEASAAAHSRNGGATSKISDVGRQTIPPDVFDRMIDGLSELTNVMRPIASLIVRNHVDSLGESMENFPPARFADLLEALSRDISDEKLRTAFRQRVGKL